MNKWLVILILSSASAWGSFTENSRRYLSPKDMFSLLNQKFPVLKDKDQLARYFLPGPQIPLSCWGLGLRNGNSTGLVLPAIGSPATATPGTAFVRWWGSCADLIVKKQFEVLSSKAHDEDLWRKYFADEILNKYRDKANPTQPYHRLKQVEWRTLTPKQKSAQIRFLIEELIGPNAIIADLGFAKGIDDLATIIQSAVADDSTLSIIDANQILITGVTLREEFITY